MKIKLNDVNGWIEGTSCVVTALAALSDETPQTIASLLSDVVADNGGYVEPLVTSAFNRKHWEEALGRLGFEYLIVGDCAASDLRNAEMIEDFLRSEMPSTARLVFCKRADHSDAHVFVVFGDRLVDVYTRGRAADIDSLSLPSEFDDFLVACIYEVKVSLGSRRRL